MSRPRLRFIQEWHASTTQRRARQPGVGDQAATKSTTDQERSAHRRDGTGRDRLPHCCSWRVSERFSSEAPCCRVGRAPGVSPSARRTAASPWQAGVAQSSAPALEIRPERQRYARLAARSQCRLSISVTAVRDASPIVGAPNRVCSTSGMWNTLSSARSAPRLSLVLPLRAPPARPGYRAPRAGRRSPSRLPPRFVQAARAIPRP